MIDLHSHILPGIDDGAPDLEASLAMAEQSVAVGVSHMVCTPHIHQSYFDNNLDSISHAYQSLVEHLALAGCSLKLSFAAEIRITPDIMLWHKQKQIPFIGRWQNKDVMLLELPHSHIPPGTDNLLRWLLKHDIQPVIAHPERNRDIIANPDKIYALKRAGCLFQATAGAFTGRFSEKVKQTAGLLLARDLVTYVASDTHSVNRRPNDMAQAFIEVAALKGNDYAERLFKTTPWLISQDNVWQ
ncbi:Tyrosine-protein phosphatase YwqE [Paraglaciecola mesophila]|uniref:protein-tyrosine-phosphatase n=1 Tax=Paraglaciecola mesophila TaxID=197222 RepID=A0A857JJV8_9ALTE|nr:CpsB/CapC family capsule biosynthesis tyrosine phosphatase [Paraglaciecola mesophila]QHJ11420.1 Tyrosine-protein phosphatase YwqE [Paraglaciecola mesophila]